MTCKKCQGCIYVGADETFCLNCSARHPLVPIPTVYREQSGYCECGKRAEDGCGVCRWCRYKDHAAQVKRGLAAKILEDIVNE